MSCRMNGMDRAAMTTAGWWTWVVWAQCGGVEEGAAAADARATTSISPSPSPHLMGAPDFGEEAPHATVVPACAAHGSVSSPIGGPPPFAYTPPVGGTRGGRWTAARGQSGSALGGAFLPPWLLGGGSRPPRTAMAMTAPPPPGLPDASPCSSFCGERLKTILMCAHTSVATARRANLSNVEVGPTCQSFQSVKS
jgi:hypothetical protein